MSARLYGLLLLLTAGCAPPPSVRWLREDVHPKAVMGDRRLDRVRIWSGDSVLEWRAVQITPDSISGIPESDGGRRGLSATAVDSLAVGYSKVDEGTTGGLETTFGAGTGSGTIVCSECTHAGRMGGTSLTIQLAQQVSPHLRAGMTTDAWCHSDDNWQRGVWDLNAVLFYYPSTERGFFVAGGPSYSMMYASVTDNTALQRHGWGFSSEMGYELKLRSATSLTPFVQYSRAWVGDIYYPIGSGIPWARGWKHQVLSVGLGVTLHDRR